jgi:hypothetical protein
MESISISSPDYDRIDKCIFWEPLGTYFEVWCAIPLVSSVSFQFGRNLISKKNRNKWMRMESKSISQYHRITIVLTNVYFGNHWVHTLKCGVQSLSSPRSLFSLDVILFPKRIEINGCGWNQNQSQISISPDYDRIGDWLYRCIFWEPLGTYIGVWCAILLLGLFLFQFGRNLISKKNRINHTITKG